MKTISSFYAVTTTSIYRVTQKKASFEVVKIDLKEESDFLINYKLTGGSMLSIGKQLIMFRPKGGMNTFSREIEQVNTKYWGDKTSFIVGLFFNQNSARDCFNTVDAEPCDPRWLDDTKKVLDIIGDEHPTFSICRYPGLALIN